MIVSRDDTPIYEAEYGSTKVSSRWAVLTGPRSSLSFTCCHLRSAAFPFLSFLTPPPPLPSLQKDDVLHLHQFVLHAALDVVQEAGWSTQAMYLRTVDKFNELSVSVYLTAGGTRLMLLHDSRAEEPIRQFFTEVHELYVKVR